MVVDVYALQKFQGIFKPGKTKKTLQGKSKYTFTVHV